MTKSREPKATKPIAKSAPVARAPRAESLPKYMLARGNKLWIRVKEEDGVWRKRPTGYNLDQVELARRFLTATMKGIATRTPADVPGVTTIKTYALEWLSDRENRGIGSVRDERGRFENHIFPQVGNVPLEQFSPRHTRDLVRALRADKTRTRAPRTLHHIFQTLHNMFESAMVDELIDKNPIIIKGGELPKKVDADPEWRPNATYTVEEVEMLIGDTRIPIERRVMYAIKVMTGMRHGEAAALCWRHIDRTVKPLAKINIVQAWDTHKREIKSTKTEQVREVPMHPELDRILTAWRKKFWALIYGHEPGPDDYVVPARTMNPIDANDANEAMKRDLIVLGLRVEAGNQKRSYARDRGGHDLRAWFRTRCLEDGAQDAVMQRMTHAEPRSVEAGYVRFSWATSCRELLMLKISTPDSDPLPQGTAGDSKRNFVDGRWKIATPTGFEPVRPIVSKSYASQFVLGKVHLSGSEQPKITRTTVPRPGQHGGLFTFGALRKALSDEDLHLAKAILERIAPARAAR